MRTHILYLWPKISRHSVVRAFQHLWSWALGRLGVRICPPCADYSFRYQYSLMNVSLFSLPPSLHLGAHFMLRGYRIMEGYNLNPGFYHLRLTSNMKWLAKGQIHNTQHDGNQPNIPSTSLKLPLTMYSPASHGLYMQHYHSLYTCWSTQTVIESIRSAWPCCQQKFSSDPCKF